MREACWHSGLDDLHASCAHAAAIDFGSSHLLLSIPCMYASYLQQHDVFIFRRSLRDRSCVKLCVCVCRSAKGAGALAAMLLEACLWPRRAL